MRIGVLLATILCPLLIGQNVGGQNTPNTKLSVTTPSREVPDWARNVADRFSFGGTDVIAADITGKFNSVELLYKTLDLRSVVTNYRGRPIVLRDILHSVDLNGNGEIGIWKVIGPRDVVTEYVRSLEDGYKTKKLFYDFSVKLSPATICCAD